MACSVWPPSMLTSFMRAVNLRAEGLQRQLAVVASLNRLFDAGSSVGVRVRQIAVTFSPARWRQAVCSQSPSAALRSHAAADGRRSTASIFAPIISSGLIILAIGRRESDSSPPSSLVNSCPARIPLNMRMVEPEFPQSRGAAGRLQLRALSLNYNRARHFAAHFTPSARRHPSVLAQSAPVEKFSSLVVPSAIPPSMA